MPLPRGAEQALQAVRAGEAPPWLINRVVEALVTAGRYTEALSLPGPGGGDEMNRLLVQINLAEAEYNLGRWDAAWERMRPLDGPAARFGITRSGMLAQRAWIAAHQGNAAAARASIDAARKDELPEPYHPEYFFTLAAVCLAEGRLDLAEEAAQLGAECAVRPSSGRNALFLLARVEAARRRWQSAASLCARAAAHRYRDQGGDGLLLWGDALMREQDVDGAERAWRLCLERDPESESAAQARQRF